MGRTLFLAAFLFMLVSCAELHVTEVQKEIVGKSSSDIEQCLGLPSHEAPLKNGMTVAEWDYNDKGNSANIPLSSLALLPVTLPLSLAGTVSLQDTGTCKAIVTFQNDAVLHLVYAGSDDRIDGEDTRCDALVRGCFRYWASLDHKTLP